MNAYLSVRMDRDLTPLFQDLEGLSLEDRMEEFMYLGLRLMRGVSGQDFYDRFSQNMFQVFGPQIRKNEVLPVVRLTDRGIDVSNRVFADFYHALKR